MFPYYENAIYDNTNLPLVVYKLFSESPDNSISQSIDISNNSEPHRYNKYECRQVHHWHNSLEILYFFRDGAGIIINGEEYYAKAGDIILVDSFDIHKNPNETIDGHYVFLIDPALLPINTATQIQFPKAYEKKWLKKDNNYEPFREIIASKMDLIIDIFEKHNIENKINYYQLYSEIFMLLAKLEEYLKDVDYDYVIKIDSSAHQREILKQIYSYVTYNYQNDISLKEISELVGFTQNYFCKFIKLSTNQTFLEFLNSYRCQIACNTMQTTNESITTIALDCGFSSISYFSKVFSKIYKISPRNYRNKIFDTK
ncbi:MAG: AraC family transcriptional regulator [Spirochaetaceae bacterium]